MKTNFAVKAIMLSVIALFSSFGGFAQDTPQLTDPEIAKVAVVANQIDVDYARMAIERTKDPAVREFANTMITDHSAIIKQAVALVTKLGVTPKDSKMSEGLLKQADQTVKKLNADHGKAFDKAYINNEVAYHKAVIGAVKTVLIPQSKNAELKALLETALPILETHLEHAEMAQSNILKK
jgi:putative membrane protein